MQFFKKSLFILYYAIVIAWDKRPKYSICRGPGRESPPTRPASPPLDYTLTFYKQENTLKF